MVKTLKDHDYGKCDCRLKFFSLVTKALKELPDLSMGPRMIGKVMSLKTKKKMLKEEKAELEKKVEEWKAKHDALCDKQDSPDQS